MKSDDDYSKTPLECYVNGVFEILTFDEAKQKIKQSNYVWIARLDRYIWDIDGFHGHNHLFKTAGNAAMKFSLCVHTSLGLPYTIDDAEIQLYGRRELSQDTFVGLAARFNRIFKKDRAR